MNISGSALLAALFLAIAQPAGAVVVDFEDIGVPAGGNEVGTNRISRDYLVESHHNHLINNQTGVTSWNDSTWLGNVGYLTLSRSDGGAFSLFSLEAGEFSSEFFPTPTGTQVVVTGHQAGGGTLTQVFGLDDVADGPRPLRDFQTVVFDAGWNNLLSVVFAPVGTSAIFYALDDITVAAVPLPAPWLLFATGLGLLRLKRRPESRRL